MGEIINLRRVKRAKAREAEAAEAAENRRRSGLTKAQREADAKRQARTDRTLDGARLDKD